MPLDTELDIEQTQKLAELHKAYDKHLPPEAFKHTGLFLLIGGHEDD